MNSHGGFCSEVQRSTTCREISHNRNRIFGRFLIFNLNSNFETMQLACCEKNLYVSALVW